MKHEEWVPPGVDPNTPSIARVYSYLLGGKDHFAVDRAMGDMSLKAVPDGRRSAQANRAFLHRVVTHMMIEAGIRQFLDLGSGLPSDGNVHEVAHAHDPTAQVIYVDNDPMALAHGRALLEDSKASTVIQADVRQPDSVLGNPTVQRLLDFEEPIGLLCLGIFHHLSDEDGPEEVAARFRQAIPSGSVMAISHFFDPGEDDPDISAQVKRNEIVFRLGGGAARWRTRAEILRLLGDFRLLDPGIVPVPEWRPEPGYTVDLQPYTYHTFIACVGVKP
ncbi:MAG: SAM-dependent methyltransferase [Micromonosporaceae bacterium]|nr:SAM-dependent methyltransferase [Micromonosporaceae bacterium]